MPLGDICFWQPYQQILKNGTKREHFVQVPNILFLSWKYQSQIRMKNHNLHSSNCRTGKSEFMKEVNYSLTLYINTLKQISKITQPMWQISFISSPIPTYPSNPRLKTWWNPSKGITVSRKLAPETQQKRITERERDTMIISWNSKVHTEDRLKSCNRNKGRRRRCWGPTLSPQKPKRSWTQRRRRKRAANSRA